ncbi:ethylene-overproduction protein 1 isoform X1 [Argentina anserina]|uniref:ethylene-overproduction protein 1 isoform X1 n=2 Tax=Argentina anserina TaxID=57926 RepID=UPI002176850D|nr:ethylene-overproduction protein 1 isoform X1 [Potentilla anserina]
MQKIYCHLDMRALKFLERFTSTQVHALNPIETLTGKTHGGVSRAKLNSQLLKSFKSNTKLKSFNSSVSVTEALLLPYGLPSTDLIEPSIEPHLKPIDFVEILADLYRRLESCESQSDRSLLFVEQYSILRSLGDPKLLRRCLRAARQNAVDVNSKVVLSAWLRFERREDELSGMSAMDCGGQILECPKIALEYGYDPHLISSHCQCDQDQSEAINVPSLNENECVSLDQEESDVTFCIDNEEINCVRRKIAMLSSPLNAMLYGSFKESRKDRIDFSENGISVKGMRAVEVYSRTRRLDLFSPGVVGDLLCFANRFCCEEMKSACDAYLASMVDNIDDALVLIEYGLEEMAFLLVAACLQVLLREFPNSLFNPKVMKFLCSSKTRERLAVAGHGSFLLYYFLSHVAMEESMVSTTTMMLLERLEECATQRWQKTLALHQLGCVLLERREFKDAQYRFLAAVEAGHVYSVAGVARTKYKQGQQYSAYTLMSSIISEYKPAGWMYQERSLYNIGKEKISDLSSATELDPILSFPYKYRAIAEVEEKQISGAIAEIDKTIRFKLSPDCIELRAWFFLALGDYESALRDIRVLLTLEPNYMMFHGKTRGDHLVELLSHRVTQMTEADCWMHLYDLWSSVDDIGSLAIIHHMLRDDPGKSLLLFRQSLLLLRLNCQKAAMRSLRLARNTASSDHERLVYEGWILYDTGNREQALSKAEKSIHTRRSFEAFFLKAYVLADASLDPESSSHVIQLLEEALRCPSDGLRKGQALNNLGSIYVDCGKLEEAANSYLSALDIKHTRAHQGLARVYHLKNQQKAAYEEMTKLIEKARNNASAYEKRSEYCDPEMAKKDLDMATELDPLRTYPYRYRAAVLMDEQKESEAVEELTKAIAFKPDLQMLHLRAAFHESSGDLSSALQDCQAALCMDPNHTDTLDLYNRARD